MGTDYEKREYEEGSSLFKELVIFAGIAILVILPIRIYIAQPFIVSGASMEPTFETGEYLIVDQISYKVGHPERGDVIIFRYPKDPSKFFIKRIIGLPNEIVKIDDGNVSVIDEDGEEILLDEPYIALNLEADLETELNDDEYFVMGDNRLASLDSRSWGPLKEDLIVGRAYFRLFPLSSFDRLPGSVK